MPSHSEHVAALRQALLAELNGYELQLCELRARMTFLDKVEQEFVKASRGKRFEIRNDITWWSLRDVHDMLVIHLASFIRGLSDEGGLFPRIRGNWLPVLKSRTPLDHLPSWKKSVIQREASEIVAARFPLARGRGDIRMEHLDHCVAAVTAQLDPLLKDRDANRAHRYQHQSADVRFLGTGDIRACFEVVQDVLKDVRYLADAAAYIYPDSVVIGPPRGTAEEMVDQVLLGVRVQRDLLEDRLGVQAPYAWQRRERVYEMLHARHDSLPEPHSECWNSDGAIIEYKPAQPVD